MMGFMSSLYIQPKRKEKSWNEMYRKGGWVMCSERDVCCETDTIKLNQQRLHSENLAKFIVCTINTTYIVADRHGVHYDEIIVYTIIKETVVVQQNTAETL